MAQWERRKAGIGFCKRAQVGWVVLASAIIGVSSSRIQAQTAQYTVTDLGVIGSDYQSSAAGINSGGTVVGESDGTGSQGVFFHAGAVTGFGTFGGSQGSATAINAGGVATGWATDSTGTTSAFTADTGLSTPGLTKLPSFGGDYTTAAAINLSNTVVGQSNYHVGTNAYAFKWSSGGGIVALDSQNIGVGTSSSANGINDAGLIVGNRVDSDGNEHGFLYSGSTMFDLNGSGGQTTDAEAINSSNKIVGFTTDVSNGYDIAFLYTPDLVDGVLTGGTYTPLDPGINSDAHAINDSAQIVGQADTGDGDTDAFLYQSGTGIENLNSLIGSNPDGWDLQIATGINDSGEIVGNGTIDGVQHAFLLSPVSVPEPAGMTILLLAGIAGTSRHTRSRKAR